MKRNKTPEINITPLIDVMLVLLIIFMVTSPMMQENTDVKLPKVGTKTNNISALEEKDVVIISFGERVFINNVVIDEDQIEKELNKLDKGLLVCLKADKNFSYEKVYGMIEKIKQVGFSQVALVGMK